MDSKPSLSVAENFTRLVRGVVNVPGEEVRKQIEKEQKARKKKRAKKLASRDEISRNA